MRRSLIALWFTSTLMLQAARYGAEDNTVGGIQIVKLIDHDNKTEVSVLVSVGNNAFDMKVNGKPVFWSPYADIKDQKAKPTMLGNPFLAPWANRLDHEGFWANGKHYRLNPDLKNFRLDAFKQPIHGLVVYSGAWQVVSLQGGEDQAAVVSRLEFWRYPDWVAQFPFAHTIEMTYRLKNGTLEVETMLENHSVDQMPVSVAYHPYFTLPGVPRDSWRLRIPVKEHVVLNDKLTPTGERKPLALQQPVELAGRQLDDVFAGVDPNGEFSMEGGGKRIALRFGPKFPVAVVYAPPGRDFVCFEPMSGITNAYNLEHEGRYPELQKIASGGRWRESFWISTSGY